MTDAFLDRDELQRRWEEADSDGRSRRDSMLATLQENRGADPNTDLRGIDLSGEDLSGFMLSGVLLEYSNLSNANLSKANLSFSTLSDSCLFQAVLDGAECLGANFRDSDCRECSGLRVGLGGADLSCANWFSANLENATLTKASLHAADFRAAKLEKTRIREANLTDADFTGASFQSADLSESTVSGAIFNGADLRETTLTSLVGYSDAEWYNTDIRHTNFCGAYLLRRYIVDENYLRELRKCDKWHNMLYWIWWITSDCGRSLLRWAAWTAVIALLFALLYSYVDLDIRHERTWYTYVYYSVVTMTTLGYGDVVPASTAAQVIASIEVILGYLALGGVLSIFANKMGRRAD